MKIEKIALFSLPISAVLTLLYFSDYIDIEIFDKQTDLSLSQKEAVYNEYIANQNAKYNNELELAFDEYDKIYQEEYSAYKSQIQNKWGEFKPSSKTEWVSYLKQGDIRRSVDYLTGTVSVDMLVKNDAEIDVLIKRNMEKQVYALLNTTEADAYNADVVAQNVEKRMPSNIAMVKRGSPGEKRIFTFDDLVSTRFNYSGNVKVSSKLNNIVTYKSEAAKVSGKKVISASFLIEKSVLQKAERYTDAVLDSSYKQHIPVALIYAIMESESNFNPMAKSEIPAYGLMQIVPRSAGKDATRHLYGKAKLLAPSYLYSTDNNIKVGAAYLHVLYHKYLRNIKDPQSRIYCTIAAYNTGATNVARAFINRKNFNQAVKHINKMTPDAVYKTLVKKLPFRETRRYIKKVTKKMNKYLELHPDKNAV